MDCCMIVIISVSLRRTITSITRNRLNIGAMRTILSGLILLSLNIKNSFVPLIMLLMYIWNTVGLASVIIRIFPIQITCTA